MARQGLLDGQRNPHRNGATVRQKGGYSPLALVPHRTSVSGDPSDALAKVVDAVVLRSHVSRGRDTDPLLDTVGGCVVRRGKRPASEEREGAVVRAGGERAVLSGAESQLELRR